MRNVHLVHQLSGLNRSACLGHDTQWDVTYFTIRSCFQDDIYAACLFLVTQWSGLKQFTIRSGCQDDMGAASWWKIAQYNCM